MFTIKETPEDFVVEEVPVAFSGTGPYAIYALRKRGMTTHQALAALSRRFSVPQDRWGVAGLKDRRAVTTQYVSLKGRKDLHMAEPCLELSYHAQHDRPLTPGQLQGNAFRITVRNLDKDDLALVEQAVRYLNAQHNRIPNYFDEQRFSAHNVAIGRLLVRKRFGEALDLLIQTAAQGPQLEAARKLSPNDVVGCLRLLPRKQLLFYIHAYQSWIFNELLAQVCIAQGVWKRTSYSHGMFVFPRSLTVLPASLPLVGFGTDQTVLGGAALPESIKPRDFVFPSIPELSSAGGERPANAAVADITLGEPLPDTLHTGKLQQEVAFHLPKGSYGSLVIRYLFAPNQ